MAFVTSSLDEALDEYLRKERRQKLMRTLYMIKYVAVISVINELPGVYQKDQIIQVILAYNSKPIMNDALYIDKIVKPGFKITYYEQTNDTKIPEYILILLLNHAFDFDDVRFDQNAAVYQAKLKEGKFIIIYESRSQNAFEL